MELVKIDIEGIYDTYSLTVALKEFQKAVDEVWRLAPPWKRYQKKLIQNLAVLCEEKEKAIDLQQFEKLQGEEFLFSIRYPNAQKNIRVIYTITEDENIILLTAFLEKNTSDYEKGIKRAKNRLKELEQD